MKINPLFYLFNATEQQLVRWELGYEVQDFNSTEHKNFGPSILTGNEAVVTGDLTDVTDTPYIFLPNINR